jgi:hypothetical protein
MTVQKREYGDFQTPPGLVVEILATLQRIGWKWGRILEPTCGRGAFIRGVQNLPNPPIEIHGIEVQTKHFTSALGLSNAKTHIHHADIFGFDLQRLMWNSDAPPWVTNAELGTLGSNNLPAKRNFRNLPGLEALTGGSNFDIAEAIWLKLIHDLASQKPAIAMLCKFSTARQVFQHCIATHQPMCRAMFWHIDSQRWFGAAVDAGLLYIDFAPGMPTDELICFSDLSTSLPTRKIAVRNGQLIADTSRYDSVRDIDGQCAYEWRQGIKHDAAAVMELKRSADTWINGLGQAVDIEPEMVYPLLKSTDLFHCNLRAERGVIVTQSKINQDTSPLRRSAPRTWQYLSEHAEVFNARKSSIYKNKAPFSMFGVGNYSFARYKVAVSGLHKSVRFHAIGMQEDRPIMLDDTCYFIALDSAAEAALLAALLDSASCQNFIGAITFSDAKRPITKKTLQRIDISALMKHSDPVELLAQARVIQRRLDPSLSGDLEETLEKFSATPQQIRLF